MEEEFCCSLTGVKITSCMGQPASLWFLDGSIEYVTSQFLIDSGASKSVMSIDFYQFLPRHVKDSFVKAPEGSGCRGFSGEVSPVLGRVTCPVTLAGRNFKVNFLVIDGPLCNILGMDFISKQRVQFDHDNQMIWCHETMDGVSHVAPDSLASVVSHIIVPAQEQLMVYVACPGVPDGTQLLAEGCSAARQAGLAVANVVVTVHNQAAVVRVWNPHPGPIKLSKGSPLVSFSRVLQLSVPVSSLELDNDSAYLVGDWAHRPRPFQRGDTDVDFFATSDSDVPNDKDNDNTEPDLDVPPHLAKLYK